MVDQIRPGGVGGTAGMIEKGKRSIGAIRATAQLGNRFVRAVQRIPQVKGRGGVGGVIDTHA